VRVCTAVCKYISAFVRIVSEFAPPPEVKLKAGVLQRNDRTKHNGKDAGRGRGRHGCAEPNIDESQFVQMKSVFSEGPMMAQAHVNSRLHSGKFWNICWMFLQFVFFIFPVTAIDVLFTVSFVTMQLCNDDCYQVMIIVTR